MTNQASIIVADDERLMREQLISRLAEVWPDGKIVAEATNGQEAVLLTQELQPQIVFLDVRMPKLTGIEAAMQISQLEGSKSIIVFVTAYDEYAVSAFEQGAIDYLLKPVSRERLKTTVLRLQQRLALAESSEQTSANAVLGQILAQMTKPKSSLNWIQATVGERLQFIAIEDVLFFQAADKYTRVVHKGGEALIRTPVAELCEKIDGDKFWQIHRATLVNVKAISEITRNFNGLPVVSLNGVNEKINVSRSYAWRFKGM